MSDQPGFRRLYPECFSVIALQGWTTTPPLAVSTMLVSSVMNVVVFWGLSIGFGTVYANTRTIEFSSSLSLNETIDFSTSNVPWSEIDARSGSVLFRLQLAPYDTPWPEICTTNGCPYEIFVKLLLDRDYDGSETRTHEVPRYSLRISYPSTLNTLLSSHVTGASASPPLQLPPTRPQTRILYARIRARDASRMWRWVLTLRSSVRLKWGDRS
ncbi:hypothetical protein BDV93DRAFT_513536 [Ceratobasidium sp. AG-I]|nr:hypothetical protein BDV93DRAFT_513536 [Ceratobasidium sp. AG-I]